MALLRFSCVINVYDLEPVDTAAKPLTNFRASVYIGLIKTRPLKSK